MFAVSFCPWVSPALAGCPPGGWQMGQWWSGPLLAPQVGVRRGYINHGAFAPPAAPGTMRVLLVLLCAASALSQGVTK